MKLLAVDYDGTYKTNLKNLYLNKIYLDEFRKKGNKLVIATGRSFSSIKKEIKSYNIKYDYLACNNGLIIFNDKDEVLAKYPLEKDNLEFIKSITEKEVGIKSKKYYNETSSTNNIESIIEVALKFQDKKSLKKFKDLLSNYFVSSGKSFNCYTDLKTCYLSEFITKYNAIEIITKLENIASSDVYAVGDGTNDLEMLQAYNGYRVLFSTPSLWFKGLPVTREVYTLVKKLNRK